MLRSKIGGAEKKLCIIIGLAKQHKMGNLPEQPYRRALINLSPSL
jgi:hypothetical protein